MNYAEIKYYDIANGDGVRTSLFVSGCNHKCENCFNKIAWDFDYGDKYTDEIENKIIESLKPLYISGLSVLGGEPLDPKNIETVKKLLKRVKKDINKSIWVYSGYTYEQLCEMYKDDDIFEYIDVLVDGRFIEELKDITLKFRGSSNQRVIDMKKTLNNNKNIILLYE